MRPPPPSLQANKPRLAPEAAARRARRRGRGLRGLITMLTHGKAVREALLRDSATTLEGIDTISGMIHGIGPICAKRLVRTFGGGVFEVIPLA